MEAGAVPSPVTTSAHSGKNKNGLIARAGGKTSEAHMFPVRHSAAKHHDHNKMHLDINVLLSNLMVSYISLITLITL